MAGGRGAMGAMSKAPRVTQPAAAQGVGRRKTVKNGSRPTRTPSSDPAADAAGTSTGGRSRSLSSSGSVIIHSEEDDVDVGRLSEMSDDDDEVQFGPIGTVVLYDDGVDDAGLYGDNANSTTETGTTVISEDDLDGVGELNFGTMVIHEGEEDDEIDIKLDRERAAPTMEFGTMVLHDEHEQAIVEWREAPGVGKKKRFRDEIPFEFRFSALAVKRDDDVVASSTVSGSETVTLKGSASDDEDSRRSFYRRQSLQHQAAVLGAAQAAFTGPAGVAVPASQNAPRKTSAPNPSPRGPPPRGQEFHGSPLKRRYNQGPPAGRPSVDLPPSSVVAINVPRKGRQEQDHQRPAPRSKVAALLRSRLDKFRKTLKGVIADGNHVPPYTPVGQQKYDQLVSGTADTLLRKGATRAPASNRHHIRFAPEVLSPSKAKSPSFGDLETSGSRGPARLIAEDAGLRRDSAPAALHENSPPPTQLPKAAHPKRRVPTRPTDAAMALPAQLLHQHERHVNHPASPNYYTNLRRGSAADAMPVGLSPVRTEAPSSGVGGRRHSESPTSPIPPRRVHELDAGSPPSPIFGRRGSSFEGGVVGGGAAPGSSSPLFGARRGSGQDGPALLPPSPLGRRHRSEPPPVPTRIRRPRGGGM
ncbi:hypothetical protein HK101_005813, partial [Irineochytrium annulatum]